MNIISIKYDIYNVNFYFLDIMAVNSFCDSGIIDMCKLFQVPIALD